MYFHFYIKIKLTQFFSHFIQADLNMVKLPRVFWEHGQKSERYNHKLSKQDKSKLIHLDRNRCELLLMIPLRNDFYN